MGKGDRARSNNSEAFLSNWDRIDWGREEVSEREEEGGDSGAKLEEARDTEAAE